MKKLITILLLSATFSLSANQYTKTDTLNLTVNTEKMSYSDIQSLLDKNIEIILSIKNSKSDIQSMISSYQERIILNGRGFSFSELNYYMNAGARIILDKSFSSFDLKQLVSIGKEKVFVIGKGIETYDLEFFLSMGASVIADRNHYGMIYTWISKYPNNILINAKDYSIFEITSWLKQGAGVWIDFIPPVYDIRSYLKLTNKYGGKVFLVSGLTYFDIQTILQ